MFESAELGHKIDKLRYRREEPKLREALLDAQYDLRENGSFPVIIIIGGVDGAGKGETVNVLHTWMDPRLLQARAFGPPNAEESERPPHFRFWQALPPKGRIGILFGSWYTDPIVDRVLGRTSTSEFDRAIEEIVRLERMLTNEGALILKFWLHLSKERQKKRLEELEEDRATRWRVTKNDWENFKRYDKFKKWSEHALRHTSRSEAPWLVVEGEDARYRELTIGKAILDGLRARLDNNMPQRTTMETVSPLPPIDKLQRLDTLDLTLGMPKPKYESELEQWQGKLSMATRRAKFRERGVVAIFEGMDAAGKGGSIRRITSALDARLYHVIPIAAPSEEERAQPYLWRFWRHIPRHGHFTIYDRSWYGRVLVERIEGFCSEYDWLRAYSEINDFEEQLVKSGIVVAKFWLQISKDEQLKRFNERQRTRFKRFKITAEDFRNRKKWDAYSRAADDMIERTSTEDAPWTLVEANDKYFARIKILRTLTRAVERSL
jgi:polyphosphate:AMP phosphotransferase